MRQRLRDDAGTGCSIALVVTVMCLWLPIATIVFAGRRLADIILIVYAGAAGLLWLAAINRDEREGERDDLTARMLDGLIQVTGAHEAVAVFAGDMMRVVTDATETLARYDEARTIELLGRSQDAMARLTEHYPTIQEDL